VKLRYILSFLISFILIIGLSFVLKFLQFSDPFTVVHQFFLSFFILLFISLVIFYNCLKNSLLNIAFLPFLSITAIAIILGANILSFYLLLSIIAGIVLALFYRLDFDYDEIYFYSFSVVFPTKAVLLALFKYFFNRDIISRLRYLINDQFYQWTYHLKNLIRSGIDNTDSTNYILEIIERMRVNFLENFIILSTILFFLILFSVSIVLNRAYSESAKKYNFFSYLRIKSRYIWFFIVGLLFIVAYYLFRKQEMLFIGRALTYFSLTIFFIEGTALIIYFNLERFYNTRTLFLLMVIFVFLVYATKGLCYWFTALVITLYGLTDFWINFRKLRTDIKEEKIIF